MSSHLSIANLLLAISTGGTFGRQIVIGYEYGGSATFDVTPECDLRGVEVGNLIEIEYSDMEGFVYSVRDLGPPPSPTRREWLEARADDEPWV